MEIRNEVPLLWESWQTDFKIVKYFQEKNLELKFFYRQIFNKALKPITKIWFSWLAVTFSPNVSLIACTLSPKLYIYTDFPGGSDGEESACNAGDTGFIHGSGRSPGKGNSNPLQYYCLENSMDRETWWVTVNGDIKELDMTEWLTLLHFSLPPALTTLEQFLRAIESQCPRLWSSVRHWVNSAHSSYLVWAFFFFSWQP